NAEDVLAVERRFSALIQITSERKNGLITEFNHKPSQHRYGKLLPIEYQESSHDPLPKTLEYLRH
ncbi:hypothetical protein, partial [Salmonella enterica]|uniref:hypothetical protein n=1 Tax=Salmonella enterica TaxID=28901 RepID=UPI001FEE56B1